MFQINDELNEFLTLLYGHGPKMNKTWAELYPDAFAAITKDVFRMQAAAKRAAVPFDQTQMLTFLVYEERLHINNAKFVNHLETTTAMKMLQQASVIRTKVQTEYDLRLAKRQSQKGEKG